MSLRRSTPWFWGMAFPFVLLTVIASGARAAILRVNASAPGAVQDGASWDTAFLSVQAAIAAAVSGDEIWIARGTYTGSFVLRVPLSLYGGFSGTETDRAARDFRANVTVLTGTGPDAVLTLSSPDDMAIVDGFVVRGTESAHRTGITGAIKAGGTITNCTIIGFETGIDQTPWAGFWSILSNVIRGNETGISASGRAMPIASNVIAFNGEGITSSSFHLVFNNTLVGNETALRIGSTMGNYTNNLIAYNGIGLAGAPFIPKNTCVWGNGVDADGPALAIGSYGNIKADPLLAMPGVGEMHLLPGSPCINAGTNVGIQVGWNDVDGQARIQGPTADIGADESDGSTPTVAPLTMRVKSDGNDANDGASWEAAKQSIQDAHDALWGHGGEIWVAGGVYRQAVGVHLSVSLVGGFAGTEPSRNTRQGIKTILAGDGYQPVLSLWSPVAPANVEGFEFRDGLSGILCLGGSPRITNSVVAGNMFGIEVQGGSPALVNNTILANDAGIFAEAGAPNVTNCLVAHNRVALSSPEEDAATVTVRHSGLFGNGAIAENLPAPDPAHGNLFVDPMLASARYGDVHLQPNSPMVDAGDDAALLPGERDMDGQLRIAGARVDIGADESDGTLRSFVPRVVRVAADGDDSRDGSAWNLSKATIEAAADLAAFEGGDVWVAGGVYAPVRLRAFSYLYGGFARTETTREARDPSVNASVVTSSDLRAAVSVFGVYRFAGVDGLTIRDSSTGIEIQSASPDVINSIFTGNDVAVFSSGGAPVVERNTLRNNFDGFKFQGGTLRVTANSFRGQTGRGISVWDADVDIRNNAILGSGGSALYVVDSTGRIVGNTLTASAVGMYLVDTTAAVANNLIAHNMSGLQVRNADDTVLTSNAFWDNHAPFTGLDSPLGQNGNIEADPTFASAAYGNVHLQPASPLRDAGDASFVLAGEVDADGRPRALDAGPDIGAYESDGTPWTVSPAIIRVKPEGDDANDGSDWTHAMKTIQAAMNRASERGGEVWAATGVYGDRVQIWPFTYLYGGFAGTEMARNERDIPANPTTLAGVEGLPLVKIRGGYTFCALDGMTLRNSDRGLSSMGSAASIFGNTFIRLKASVVDTEGAIEFAGNTVEAAITPAKEAAIATVASDTRILNNILANTGLPEASTGNGVSLTGGAPLLANNVIARYNVSVSASEGAATVVNNTMVDNLTGVAFYNIGSGGLILVNNIIRSKSVGVNRTSGTGTPVIRYNDVVAPTPYFSLQSYTGQFGNISSDPLFREDPMGAFNAEGLRLRFASPATDAGDNAYVVAGWPSLDGSPRIAGERVDMGAYESPYARPTMADVATALRLAAGLSPATPAELERYDVIPAPVVDIRDALVIARVFAASF